MAELTKLKTGSIGPQGETIYDVFAGEEHIKDPADPRLKGIEIATLPDRPQAPTGFQSQFLPVELPVAEKIPADVLEDKTTAIDIQRVLAKNLAEQNKTYENLIKLARPTEAESALSGDILELQEMLRQGVQQVEERPLEGTVLKSGIANEINNIVQGNTREALVILRQIDTKTRLLTVEQQKRQQELEVEKLKLEREGFQQDSMLKMYGLIRQMEQDEIAREDRLTAQQQNFLANITERYIGMAYNELDAQLQRDVAGEALRLDPSGGLLAGIKNRMNLNKEELELDRLNTRSLDEPKSIFTQTQLNKGATTAMIPLSDFMTFDDDTKNYFISYSSLITDAYKEIDKAVEEGITREEIEGEIVNNISSSPLSNETKRAILDSVIRYLNSKIKPTPVATPKKAKWYNPLSWF